MCKRHAQLSGLENGLILPLSASRSSALAFLALEIFARVASGPLHSGEPG